MAHTIEFEDPTLDEDDQEDAADDGLSSYIYRLSEKSWTETFKWRSLMLMPDGVYLSSVKEARSKDFERKVNERSFFEKRVTIPWSMLTEMVIDDGVVQFNWFDRAKGKDARSRMKFEDAEDAENVVAIVAGKMEWVSHFREGTLWRGLLSRVFGLLLTAGFTWLLLSDAHDIEQGLEPVATGRRAATKLFLWKLAGWLGPVGIWVAGSTVMLVIIGKAIQWYRGRQPAAVWRKGS